MCSSKDKKDTDTNDIKSQFEITLDTLKLDQYDFLQGVWWLNPTDNSALFNIVNDSLYYTEDQQSPYLIKIKGSALMMTRDSTTFKLEIKKLTHDSLILYDKNLNQITKLFKQSKE